jgi:hypothetical protein
MTFVDRNIESRWKALVYAGQIFLASSFILGFVPLILLYCGFINLTYALNLAILAGIAGVIGLVITIAGFAGVYLQSPVALVKLGGTLLYMSLCVFVYGYVVPESAELYLKIGLGLALCGFLFALTGESINHRAQVLPTSMLNKQ